MAWETIFSQVYTVDAETERITLPVTFSPYFRLIINTSLLTGLGNNERFLGTLSQQLNIPEIGDVKGRSLALSPSLQLLTPATEFPYKLVYQPVRGQQFSFELEIQVEMTVGAANGTDNAPVLAAIANLQQTIDALPETTTGTDYSATLASLIAGQDEIRVNIAGLTDILLAINSGQDALIEQTTALQAVTAANHAETTATLAAIADLLNSVTVPQVPSALGIAYVASQSSVYQGVAATYARLTDGDGTTGGACTNATTTEWIAAAFPETVKVASVTVGGGALTGWGQVAFYCNGAKLQHSNNGTTWVEVWTVAGVTDTGSTQYITYTPTTPIEARYWRLYGKEFLAVTEFKFA